MTYPKTAKQIWLADIADDRCTIGSGDQEIARDIPLDIGRLIAAAPDLLAALRALLPYAENEAHALQELRDSEAAEAAAEAAWQAVENALEIIERATATR